MQTYTHLAIGVLAGRLFFPNSLTAQGLCVFGSVLPDLTMVPVFLLDKVRGNKVSSLTNKAPWLQSTVEALHSIPVLFVLTIVSVIINIFVALCVGLFLHIVIDLFTHSDDRFLVDDVTHLWPIPTEVKLGHVINFWEYRIKAGDLTPKTEEKIALLLVTAAAVGTFF